MDQATIKMENIMKNKYWWQYILAIPPEKDTHGRKVIERIITDKTRYQKTANGSRLHEFYNPNHETNLTVSTWENFRLFESFEWINRLIDKTENKLREEVIQCNWSYEWEKRIDGKVRLCDVVINYKTEACNSIIIIESKNKGKKLGDKDIDLDYYLGLDDFDKYDKKYLIYCIDEAVLEETESVIQNNENVGIITWQQLCQIQMEMIEYLDVDERIKLFMQSSIYSQFNQKELAPNHLSYTYLKDEMPMHEYVEVKCNSKEMQSKLWEVLA